MIGASALEDMLQENVPDCINDFRKAGINVWMLTGDKFETAENIGFSCKMFDRQTQIFRMKRLNTEEQIQEKLREIEN
jgi:P-type E1-E2 ATPase